MFDEILGKILESELLSEETKSELAEQWHEAVDAVKAGVREEVTAEVRTELAGQWITERDELISKVDASVAEALTRELTDRHGDIERFRDLEVEQAQKLVEEKHRLAGEVAEELDALVDKIDAFFEMRLAAEMEDLKEDIEVVKQNNFGRQLFEAYASTYAQHYVDEDAVQAKLLIAEDRNADLERRLETLEEERNKMVREAKMEQILQPLTGKKREQMVMVLKNVDTARLEESYKYFIGRILKEEEQPVLRESKKTTTVVTGNGPTPEVPANDTAAALKEQLDRVRSLAGIMKSA